MITEYNKFRIDRMKKPNDGNRTLFESIIHIEVIKALEDWVKLNVNNCVLINGIALSYYVTPRMTQDVDMLFLTKNDIPLSLKGFKKTRNGAFQHNKTHVEVEVIIPQSINLRVDLAEQIFKTAIKNDNIYVASPEGIIVSKLGRFSKQDQADIENILFSQKIDLSIFNLTEEELEKFNKLKEETIILMKKLKMKKIN
jgi:hypothetical protein